MTKHPLAFSASRMSSKYLWCVMQLSMICRSQRECQPQKVRAPSHQHGVHAWERVHVRELRAGE